MGFIIKKRKHIFTRILPGMIVILIIGISPILIGLAGATVSEWATGERCHEGNCAWMALPWLTMLTFPASIAFEIIYVVLIVMDLIELKKSKR